MKLIRSRYCLCSLMFALFHSLYATDILIDSKNLEHATISAYAVCCDGGKVVFSKNATLSVMPASCMKIVTTAASLHILGPNSRLETHLEYDGWIDENKTLHGNIYIKGGGDPCLGSERIKGSSWQRQVQVWSDAIQTLGILKIAGNIVPDMSRWEKALCPPGWSWEDIGNYYGAGASALSFHENAYSLTFKPGIHIGEPAKIVRTDPPVDLHFQNEVTTGASGSGDRACIYGSEFSPIRHVRGTIPLGVEEFSIKGSVEDPGALAAQLLIQELEKRKIDVQGSMHQPAALRVAFHKTLSPTIGEIVYWTNQKSINLYAEHLLKKMGEAAYQDGSTVSGIKAVLDFWKSQGIVLNGFHMADGCGLSRKNLVTAKQTVDILLHMKRSSLFTVFLESLPEKEGGIRAKSGSMSLIKGCAGYAGNIAFAIFINQCQDQQAMQKHIHDFLLQIQQLEEK